MKTLHLDESFHPLPNTRNLLGGQSSGDMFSPGFKQNSNKLSHHSNFFPFFLSIWHYGAQSAAAAAHEVEQQRAAAAAMEQRLAALETEVRGHPFRLKYKIKIYGSNITVLQFLIVSKKYDN